MSIAEGGAGETEGDACRLCGEAEGEGAVGSGDQTAAPGVCVFMGDRKGGEG